jgi:hypothetical protein
MANFTQITWAINRCRSYSKCDQLVAARDRGVVAAPQRGPVALEPGLSHGGSIAKALAASVRTTGRDAAVQWAFAVRPVAPDQERDMIAYRCYLLGGDGKIKRAEVIECPTDAAALQEAERRLATCEHPSIEVWERARRVGIVGYSTDHAGTKAPGHGASIDFARV